MIEPSAVYRRVPFSLECDTRRVLVWRDRGTRNNPAFVRERSQYRRAGWMDDNARPHRARLVENMLEAETIQRMEWPACSPDRNPTEHIWDILGRRIAARPRPPATVRDLEIALLEEWNSIPQSLIDNLIASMENSGSDDEENYTCLGHLSRPDNSSGSFRSNSSHGGSTSHPARRRRSSRMLNRSGSKRLSSSALASQLHRNGSRRNSQSSDEMYPMDVPMSIEDDVLDLNQKVNELQQQVATLTDNQINTDQRYNKVKQENAALQNKKQPMLSYPSRREGKKVAEPETGWTSRSTPVIGISLEHHTAKHSPQASMSSQGFEARLYGTAISIANHYTGWVTDSTDLSSFRALGAEDLQAPLALEDRNL
ncbi:rab11 family-interacting protein 4 [Trichonephila clavipes]|nr:rab11 family-interacting protein 4 [Trichonephila clavipes]